jgi:hypothetical protein
MPSREITLAEAREGGAFMHHASLPKPVACSEVGGSGRLVESGRELALVQVSVEATARK